MMSVFTRLPREVCQPYHENNVRELEVTQHVSLVQLNPLALITLRATGSWPFDIPDELLDLEGPSRYFRRLRSVSLSVPCVTGPYTRCTTVPRVRVG